MELPITGTTMVKPLTLNQYLFTQGRFTEHIRHIGVFSATPCQREVKKERQTNIHAVSYGLGEWTLAMPATHINLLGARVWVNGCWHPHSHQLGDHWHPH